MSEAPPPSLLITPDLRRRLQQQYEEAARLLGVQPPDHRRMHDLLADCLRTDPGNILYLNAILANLRHFQPNKRISWLPQWLQPSVRTNIAAPPPTAPYQLLRQAPELLLAKPRDAALFRRLAEACGAGELNAAEIRYWQAACELEPENPAILRGFARTLTRQGQFEEALSLWQKVAALDPQDGEAAQAIADLALPASNVDETVANLQTEIAADPTAVEPYLQLAAALSQQARFAEAERVVQDAQAVGGGDLGVREARESLQQRRSEHRLLIARRRASSDFDARARRLIEELEREHNRLCIDLLYIRCERNPVDRAPGLELARRLKKAGNFSGAIQRLESMERNQRPDTELLIELGECWQHLRQFTKALAYYQQAIALGGDLVPGPIDRALTDEPRKLALYRGGVLAAAMGRNEDARHFLSQLIRADADYKDARERLDKLGPP